ncbi:hypothetical protein OROMI_019926 [Orobanche minor]
MDPIQGSNQTHQTYWERIAAFYYENKTFSSDRTANSLSHRWSVINSSVSKFVGYYNQVQEKNQSGLSEQDKRTQRNDNVFNLPKENLPVNTLLDRIAELSKIQFNFGKKPRKSPLESSTSSASAQSQFIGTPVPESEGMERPMALTEVKDTVSKLSEARHEKIQQIIELEKERFKVAEERERAREERERAREERDNRMYEMSILSIDTSTMEAPLAEYYKSLKADILKKRI